MNQKKHSSQIGLPIVTVICAIFLITVNALADVNSEAENLLAKIKQYDFGQSRESLTNFSDLVRHSIDSPENKQILEKGMLEFLKSDATFAGKQFICKQLSIIGTEKAVPTLEPMLKDKKTSDMARYALERIPGKKVNEVLRKTLKKTKSKVRIGIINTLGERRDKEAVESIGKFVFKSDETTAIAAAAALGKIADDNSVGILATAKDKTKGEVKAAVLDSYLKCADKLEQIGEKKAAAKIYNELFSRKYSAPVRSAALRGLINTDKKKGGKLILTVLKNGDEKIKTTAISLIRELPQSQQVQNIAAELPNLSVLQKIQLISALADRGDTAIQNEIRKAVKDESVDVRIAALKAIASLGDENDIELLAGIAARGEAGEKETAQESLALLNSPNVDKIIISKIPSAETDLQVELIQSVGARNISDGVNTLLKTAAHENRKIRIESIKSLELIAAAEDLPALINLLVNVPSAVERRRAEKTVVTVAHKIENRNEQAADVLKKLPSTEDVEAQCSLLRVLGNIGDANALLVLRKALENKNEDIQKASIQALSDWPSPEPLDDLLAVTKSATNKIHQKLALRGFIRLIGFKSERTDEEKIKLYLTAMNLASSSNEKKMVLSGISNIRTLNALNTAAKFLTEADLKAEAEVAIIKIARYTRGNFPDETKAVLLKVVDSTNNEVRNDAFRYLDEINK